MVRVIVGTQFGDEGKGRAVEFLAPHSQVIARYQGGANAGHTIHINEEPLVFHLVPSGIIYPHTLCIIGNGVVLDPEELIKEITLLKEKGISIENRFFISPYTHIVMPYHKLRDDSNHSIGTTRRGIGPCYEDKYGRRGIRLADLSSPEILEEKLKHNLSIFKSLPQDSANNLEFNSIYEQYLSFGKFLSPFVADTALLLNRWIDEGKEVLLEGAQGLLLDIDHGTYPFVTSSNPHSGGASTGLGISPTRIDEVIGITKAYTTRVGKGPLPTRLPPDIEEKVRECGKEYGATTGRPRRCGWLDVPLLRRALMLNDIKQIILTKLDVLDELPEIKICKEYKNMGAEWCANLENSEPVYETLPGWMTSTQSIRKYADLPVNTKRYIERISGLLEVKIMAVFVGPQKEATIEL
ncbi:adenylosuccinate synthase [candidate division WOR-3 bacterium]|nr:adenylosuccinate synthase [candidate division WOR-3 bacterium]